jgi:predicted nucleic acid-binding protein
VILYLDASALVKRYIQEKASQDVNTWIETADMVVTGLITRVEVASAIARPGSRKLEGYFEEYISSYEYFRISSLSDLGHG